MFWRIVGPNKKRRFGQHRNILKNANLPKKLRVILILLLLILLDKVVFDLRILVLENSQSHIQQYIFAHEDYEKRVDAVDEAIGHLDVSHRQRPTLQGDLLEYA